MKISQSPFNIVCKIKQEINEKKFKKIAEGYDIKGYKRIYLFHIRKTGGTSLNKMFLYLGNQDYQSSFRKLVHSPDHRILENEKIFLGWNCKLITKGNYFYAFSHTPFHKLNLPDKTFTISCFRDPVKRVISHYNMLMDFAVNNISHPCMKTEAKWLGDSFDDFIERIPPQHLLNQLYMFSPKFNVNDAVNNVKKLSYYFFTDEFSQGIETLNKKTDLNLKPIHLRKANYHAQIDESSIAKLRKMLEQEYYFLEKIIE